MAETHDFETTEIVPSQLTVQDVLVGECGGLSAVLEVGSSIDDDGTWPIYTEHGTLHVPSAETVTVLAGEDLVRA